MDSLIRGREHRRRLVQLMEMPPKYVDLAEAALLVARDHYPSLEVETYLKELDRIAAYTAPRVPSAESPSYQVDRLATVLHQSFGFSGNVDNYYDERNSYLNEVLDRRVGIPITLSIVYHSVAERLGIPLAGVNFPGHFLLCHVQAPEIILDPFHGGQRLALSDCVHLLHSVFGRPTPLRAEYLHPMTPRQVILRLLNNLKHIYVEQEWWERALEVVEMSLLIDPTHAPNWRDRGLILYRLGHLREADFSLGHYVHMAPDAPDADRVRSQWAYVTQSFLRLN